MFQGVTIEGVHFHDSNETDLADMIRESLKNSHFLNWRDEWTKMSLNKENLTSLEEKTSSLMGKLTFLKCQIKLFKIVLFKKLGIMVPPEMILNVYQLLLMVGDKTFYSNKIWSEFEECPIYKRNTTNMDHIWNFHLHKVSYNYSSSSNKDQSCKKYFFISY